MEAPRKWHRCGCCVDCSLQSAYFHCHCEGRQRARLRLSGVGVHWGLVPKIGARNCRGLEKSACYHHLFQAQAYLSGRSGVVRERSVGKGTCAGRHRACLFSCRQLMNFPSTTSLPIHRRASHMLSIPEVQIVHAPLHIAHVDVERKQIHGCCCPARQDFEEVG